MWKSFAMQNILAFLQQKIKVYLVTYILSVNEKLPVSTVHLTIFSSF